MVGGLLIAISGAVNIILGAQIGAILYTVYPGGYMGHVGIVDGTEELFWLDSRC